MFEDLHALIVSEKTLLHQREADCASAVHQLSEWFLEDVESMARSFELDPTDVLIDAFKLIVTETPLANRIIKAQAEMGTPCGVSHSFLASRTSATDVATGCVLPLDSGKRGK